MAARYPIKKDIFLLWQPAVQNQKPCLQTGDLIDSDFILDDMEARGGTAIIPARKNLKVQIPVNDYVYVLHNKVESCFNKMKNARRLATRYDKTLSSYLGFVQITAIRVWIKYFVNNT